MRGIRLIALLAAVLCLLAGYLVAGVLNSALAIRFEDKTLPPERTTQVRPAEPLGPVAALGSMEITCPCADDPLLSVAGHELGSAVSVRTHAGTPVTLLVDVETDRTDDSFQVTRDGDKVTVTGSRKGAANGLFRLADTIASGGDWADLADGKRHTPALAHRFVDTGAVGVVPDVAAYREQTDYAHTSGAFDGMVLDHAPWIDPAGLERTTKEWRDFVDRVASYGYNGILVPGFLEYVSFDTVGNGTEVYAADSPARQRQQAMREQVGAMWRYADEMGLDVVFKTDMLALSKPLEDHLTRELGGIDANDPKLWEVYRKGIDELFTTFPWADGLMIRIGEAGAIYNAKDWDYYSALKVTDADGVRTMLRTAAEAAAGHDATVYFRTWLVGVGDVGDMHTNPETYARVLDGLDLDNLVVSTKFTTGDFDSYLPLNPTLFSGKQSRIVELQGRREFEAFSSVPNDMGPTHQEALRQFREANPKIAGLWLWTQDGGPWRAGPMSLYLTSGFWQLYDLNVYAGGRLAWDPTADLAEVNRSWIRRTLTTDPAAVDAVAEILSLSRSAVLDGFYIKPYAEQAVFALGLEPPPMMWIFKWDIVSGDAAALAAVYLATKGRVDEAIADGARAVTTVGRMRTLLDAIPRESFTDPKLHDALTESLTYEADLFATLQSYRVAFLRYYEWVDTGSSSSYAAWRAALADYRTASAAHTARWTGNLETPPYEFFAADAGLTHAGRAKATRTAAWVILAICIGALALVPALRRGAFTPWRLGSGAAELDARQQLLVLALPLLAVIGSRLAFSAAASWAYLLATLGSLALLALSARILLWLLRPGASPTWLWAALGGMLLLRTALLCGAMAFTGPGGYWFRFWTDERMRTAYVTLAVGAFLWGLIVVALVLRGAYGLSWPASVGSVLACVGIPLLALGGLLTAAGLESSLTTLNDQMAVLPLGLSRILGLVTHLGIPRALPSWLLLVGAVLVVLGSAGGAAAVRARR